LGSMNIALCDYICGTLEKHLLTYLLTDRDWLMQKQFPVKQQLQHTE